MTIPPFVNLEHDEAARKAYVTVEDREVKKQREMWGTAFPHLQWHNALILGLRNNSSIPTKPYPWSFRRSHSYSTIGGSWIQSNS
jgi:hypothetical protein